MKIEIDTEQLCAILCAVVICVVVLSMTKGCQYVEETRQLKYQPPVVETEQPLEVEEATP